MYAMGAAAQTGRLVVPEVYSIMPASLAKLLSSRTWGPGLPAARFGTLTTVGSCASPVAITSTVFDRNFPE